eukprot:GHVU01119683.1.p1 GENE.GHVU01119683.1~~GHVU01119683.1.p1  ORF type:complete len:223 (+),score=50.38 GHVU01119683.1:208-876(+)
MPRNGPQTNHKAEEARARKAEAAEAKRLKEEQRLEDEKWVDSDKSAEAKLRRKTEKEKKHIESLSVRNARRELYDEEDRAFHNNRKEKFDDTPKKVTRAEIMQRQLASAAEAPEPERPEIVTDLPLEPNPNRERQRERLEAEQSNVEIIEGRGQRGVDAAIAGLAAAAPPEKMPTRRKLFETFRDQNLPGLQHEYPTLRRQQLMDKLQKMWQKAPENPERMG